jgi:hypothetical protein
MLRVRVAFLLLFSFPLRGMYFVHLCPKEEKKKTREKYLHHKATGPHQGTLHSILKRAGNTLLIYLTKAVIFFSLLHSFIQVQCSLVVLRYELRLATVVSVQVFAQVFQSPRDHQQMLRYIYAVLLPTSTKTKVECVAVFDTFIYA